MLSSIIRFRILMILADHPTPIQCSPMPGFIKGKEARELTRGKEVMKGRVDREAGWIERQGR
jgi:hypothetical protein